MNNAQILSCSKVITTHHFDSKQPLSVYTPHRGLINCATFNHTNKVIASCGQDGRIVLVSSQKNDNLLAQFVFQPKLHNSTGYTFNNHPSINCCMFSPHSKFIAAGSVDSIIKIWQMKNHKETYLTLKSHSGGVTSLSWSRNQDILASSSANGDIFLHSIKTGGVVEEISLKGQEGINCVRISQGDSYSRLAACTNSGSIMIWDLDSTKTAKHACLFENPMKVSVTSLSFSTFNPVLLVTSSIDQNLTFYDISQKKAVKTIATEQPLTAVNFHSDGHTLLAGGMYGGLFVYDLRKPQKPKEKLIGHQTAIKYIDFHKERESSTHQGTSGAKEKTRTVVVNGSLSKIPIKQKQKDNNEENFKKEEAKNIKGSNTKEKEQAIITSNIIPKRQQLGNVSSSNHESRVTSFDLLPHPSVNPPQPHHHPVLQNELQALKKSIESSISQKFQLLHLQIIRQFQIQQQELQAMLLKANQVSKSKDEYIKQLESQNAKLKSNRY